MNDLRFTFEDALCLTNPIVPYKWEKHNLTIVRDGYLSCGTRIHVVEEQGYEKPSMLSNAVIISEDLGFSGK